jgi:hypothetical protein
MAVGSPTTPQSYVNGPCGVDSHRVPTITAEDQLKTLTPGAYFCAPDGKVHIYYPHAGPPTTATTNTPAEPQKMVDLVASVVLAIIFIPIMIAFLLAAAWFWCALFVGTPFTYSMLQGIWLVPHKARGEPTMKKIMASLVVAFFSMPVAGDAERPLPDTPREVSGRSDG